MIVYWLTVIVGSLLILIGGIRYRLVKKRSENDPNAAFETGTVAALFGVFGLMILILGLIGLIGLPY